MDYPAVYHVRTHSIPFEKWKKEKVLNIYINSVYWLLFTLTNLQNLINRPVMNCSMSIFPFFYFSRYILLDFPSSGLIFL